MQCTLYSLTQFTINTVLHRPYAVGSVLHTMSCTPMPFHICSGGIGGHESEDGIIRDGIAAIHAKVFLVATVLLLGMATLPTQ